MPTYTIKDLRGDELKALNTITPIPFPELTLAKVAYDEAGVIVGFALFQLVPHVDGFWIDPAYRGGDLTAVLATAVCDAAKEAADYYVSIATNPFVDTICKNQGMRQLPGNLYVWKRGPEGRA